MTVDFPWDGVTPETISASTLPGCLAGDVVTTANDPDRQVGNVWFFTGTKTFTCAGGQLVLAYRSTRVGEARSAFGAWVIIGGTGAYAGVEGRGLVEGLYTYDTLEQRSGIVDSYVGHVTLPT